VDIDYRLALRNHMTRLLERYHGLGLAANQINLDASVFVMVDYYNSAEPLFCINPAVHEVSDHQVLMTEGCLSEPDLYLKVKRPAEIKVSWETIEGERAVRELDGMRARIFLHEYDHLCGILFTDRVGRAKLDAARRKQRKISSR
jgi:peptide deformylase